jgi:plastocyanin
MKTFIVPLFAALAVASLRVPAAVAGPAAATVHIKNFAFDPAKLNVPASAAVTFVNDDQEPHTATAVDHSFDSEAIDTNGTWSHTFAKPGSYAYFCEMHPYMKGTLVVTAAK